MKMGDIKPCNVSGGFTTVGQIRDYLKQFPDKMPIRAHAEIDACQEEGHPFIGVHGDYDPVDGEITEAEENQLTVTHVVFSVDH